MAGVRLQHRRRKKQLHRTKLQRDVLSCDAEMISFVFEIYFIELVAAASMA